jgi:hypothetical protein
MASPALTCSPSKDAFPRAKARISQAGSRLPRLARQQATNALIMVFFCPFPYLHLRPRDIEAPKRSDSAKQG